MGSEGKRGRWLMYDAVWIALLVSIPHNVPSVLDLSLQGLYSCHQAPIAPHSVSCLVVIITQGLVGLLRRPLPSNPHTS